MQVGVDPLALFPDAGQALAKSRCHFGIGVGIESADYPAADESQTVLNFVIQAWANQRRMRQGIQEFLRLALAQGKLERDVIGGRGIVSTDQAPRSPGSCTGSYQPIACWRPPASTILPDPAMACPRCPV